MRHLLLSILFFCRVGWAAEMPLVLAPGETRRVHLTGTGPIVLGNGKVAKVRELGRDLQITGSAKGQTQLTAGTQSWSVLVLDRVHYETYEALAKILDGMLGLELGATPEQVQIRGELLRWQDWQDIKEALGTQAHFQFAARLSDRLQQEAELHFGRLLQSAHLPMPSLQFEPRASVHIPESEKSELPEFQEILEPYGVSADIGHQLVALEPMIRVKIVVAEVDRKQFQHLGLQWPDSATASLVHADGTFNVTTPDWILHALEQDKVGKVLASPNILCRSGKTAEFLAGGEFPIKIISKYTHEVQWKRHGVLLKIQPQVDLAGNMSVGLETEVSMIDKSQTVDGIPGLLTNRIQSHFDLKRTQTIALSGMIKHEWGDSREGLPWLSRIPMLGALFSSREYLDNKTELVIFVTPEVMNEGNSTLPMPEELHHAQ